MSIRCFSVFEYSGCFMCIESRSDCFGVWFMTVISNVDLQFNVSMYKHAYINLRHLFCFWERHRRRRFKLPITKVSILYRNQFTVLLLLTVKCECRHVELEISFSQWRCWRTGTQWVTWSYSIFYRSSASSSSRARCSKSWKRKKQYFVIINSFANKGCCYI